MDTQNNTTPSYSPSKSLTREIARRRTFAIISHPDAGKTTLTEKLLLYGGALHLAGAVRSKKAQQDTASDWMSLEQERGISVSSTVLQFEYEGCAMNLLDTPGHKDFSEDTYRVLTAVDSVIMVLDAAKGIEEQTLKLFEVCRSKGTPIFTFINKCERPGKDPLGLLDEIEETLNLRTFPVTWPIGSGGDFHGVYDRVGQMLHRYERVSGGRFRAPTEAGDWDSMEAGIPDALRETAREELELLESAGADFDLDAFRRGELSPVFFGSALQNFGIELLLSALVEHAPSPQPREAGGRTISPEDSPFSAFVFKIQANTDPRHRDRMVFLRICSGQFKRNMQVLHAQSGRKLRLSFSHHLFGKDRETLEESWPGDILGLSGQNEFGIGDTLTEDASILYDPIPHFAPECFAYAFNGDRMNTKQYRAGMEQLLQEKVVQKIVPLNADGQAILLGAVGPLQFEVVSARLESEYGAKVRMEPGPWSLSRWLEPGITQDDIPAYHRRKLAHDAQGNLMILFNDEWEYRYFTREHPEFELRSSIG